jgi:hypothetical protein
LLSFCFVAAFIRSFSRSSAGRLAGTLGGADLGHELARCAGEVAAQVLALDQHGADRAARAAFLEVALAPLHRLRVLLGAVVADGDRLDHAHPVAAETRPLIASNERAAVSTSPAPEAAAMRIRSIR